MTPMEQDYSNMRMFILILLDRLGGETEITEAELVGVDLSRKIEVSTQHPFSNLKIKATES